MDPAGHQSRHNSSCAGPRRPEDLIRNKEQRRRERRERRARRQRRFYHGAGGPTAGRATNTIFSFVLLLLPKTCVLAPHRESHSFIVFFP